MVGVVMWQEDQFNIIQCVQGQICRRNILRGFDVLGLDVFKFVQVVQVGVIDNFEFLVGYGFVFLNKKVVGICLQFLDFVSVGNVQCLMLVQIWWQVRYIRMVNMNRYSRIIRFICLWVFICGLDVYVRKMVIFLVICFMVVFVLLVYLI